MSSTHHVRRQMANCKEIIDDRCFVPLECPKCRVFGGMVPMPFFSKSSRDLSLWATFLNQITLLVCHSPYQTAGNGTFTDFSMLQRVCPSSAI